MEHDRDESYSDAYSSDSSSEALPNLDERISSELARMNPNIIEMLENSNKNTNGEPDTTGFIMPKSMCEQMLVNDNSDESDNESESEDSGQNSKSSNETCESSCEESELSNTSDGSSSSSSSNDSNGSDDESNDNDDDSGHKNDSTNSSNKDILKNIYYVGELKVNDEQEDNSVPQSEEMDRDDKSNDEDTSNKEMPSNYVSISLNSSNEEDDSPPMINENKNYERYEVVSKESIERITIQEADSTEINEEIIIRTKKRVCHYFDTSSESDDEMSSDMRYKRLKVMDNNDNAHFSGVQNNENIDADEENVKDAQQGRNEEEDE